MEEVPSVPENEVLSLIISQLIAYGYSAIAQSVADATGATTDMTPSHKLVELLQLGKEKLESDESDDEEYTASDTKRDLPSVQQDWGKTKGGFDPDAVHTAVSKVAPSYTQLYYTQHKGPCRTAAFSADGRFAATGSHDSSLKVLDVQKMKKRTGDAGDKPVIRTLYDHSAPVNDLSFHPNGLVLASCAEDQSVKLFDLSKLGVKRSFRYFQDSVPVKSISFHPAGDYLLAGTDDAAVRIYDVKTLQCFTNSKTVEMHRGPITQIRYSHTGKLFATSSADGSVRVWDGVSGQCVRYIEGAHGGTAASSVRIMQNERYVLTAGLDSTMRLWDISSGRTVVEYRGHEQRSQMLQPAFTYNEDYVMIGDEASTNAVCYDTQTGELLSKISGQNNLVRCVVPSPTDNGILTCSDDYRARYFMADFN
ncbi:WD40-repeat-containing domain protein [Fennellomyces sp. T-0311]|nr:WD40-repeat-containing domain protein [Fennellomyces sp. T-0311]